MQKTAHVFIRSGASIPVLKLTRFAQDWILDGEIRQLSKSTLALRKIVTEKLLWFLQLRNMDSCGTSELRAFLAYMNTGHEGAEGRWGNAKLKERVRPRTVLNYFRNLRSLFVKWTPSSRQKKPRNKVDFLLSDEG